MKNPLKKPIRLTLFFTYPVSLQIWDEQGLFDREVALYQRLQQQGIQVSFVTYGDKNDLKYAERLPGIKVLCNRWRLPHGQYARWLFMLHAPWLWRSHLIKTNQIFGAEIALRTASFWRKPLIARCGYMLSEFFVRQYGNNSVPALEAQTLEAKLFSRARRVVVTTSVMKDAVAQRIPQAANSIVVIPNYVNIDHFRPAENSIRNIDIIFVGRVVAQKNIETLLEAIAPLNMRTCLIGEGELFSQLQQKFSHIKDWLDWQGYVPHSKLPEFLRRSRLFVLPSHYEGHPKALLEAMSCGMPVIGTNTPGIRELITHGKTGWLCDTDVDSIREAIRHLMNQPELCETLGKNARQYALKNFSLDKIIEMEMTLLKDTVVRRNSH